MHNNTNGRTNCIIPDRIWISSETLELFTDSAGSASLGCGAYFSGHWAQFRWPAHWEKEKYDFLTFMHDKTSSNLRRNARPDGIALAQNAINPIIDSKSLTFILLLFKIKFINCNFNFHLAEHFFEDLMMSCHA
jgi:hypothetical protein